MRLLGLADESRKKTSDVAPDDCLIARGQTRARKVPEGSRGSFEHLLRVS